MKNETCFKGDKAEYTGRTEKLYGVLWYEVRLLEGHEKGKTKLVKFAPGEVAVN